MLRVLCSAMFLFSATCTRPMEDSGQPIARHCALHVSQTLVAREAKKIGTSLRRRRVIRTVLITGGSMLILHQLWTLLQEWENSGKDQKKNSGTSVQEEKLSWAQWIQSGKTWRGFGSIGVHLAASCVTQHVFQLILSKYVVPSTLSWFVSDSASYRTTFLELDAHIAGIRALQEGEEEKSAYHLQAIRSSYGTLLRQLTHLLGFMSFRRTQMKERKAAEVEAIVVHLLGKINESVAAFGTCTRTDGPDCQSLAHLLDQLHDTLEIGCMQFARLECSEWTPRCAALTTKVVRAGCVRE